MRRRKDILLVVLASLLLLASLLAWRIHTWGQPLRVVFRPIQVIPADAESGRSVTYMRLGAREGQPKRYVTLDSDGDGTVDQVLTEGPLGSFSRPAPDDPEARWLVLCVDGVPYLEFLALWEEGHFREFFRPAPLIAPFPTASGIALTEAFHTGAVMGYEDGYFDRKANRLSGGSLKTTLGEDIPYLKLLDYDLPGPFRGLAYVLPQKSFHADLGRLRRRFLESRNKVYFAHIATTDSIYHVLPRAEARRLLLGLDALLRQLYLEANGKLRITVFSDHGNSLAEGHPVPLAAYLASEGWQLAKRCGEARAVVVPAYGLLGFFAVYCVGDEKAALAQHLAKMEGVDVVVYAEPGGAVVENREGRVRLEWKEDGSAFRYQPQESDPLKLADILARLKEEGKLGPEGWISDQDLLAATAAHVYPDPGHRLWQWARNHVRNPADVLVSLKPGYHQGSKTFEYVVTMLSTHGSMDRAQTLGFATTTDGPLTAPLRSKDLLPPNLTGLKADTGASPVP